MVEVSKPERRNVEPLTRGVSRFLRSLDRSALTEVVLASSRRADILSIGPKGDIWIIEIKSSVQDFRSDSKWPEYRLYCDQFFFACDASVPQSIFPEDTGFILGDNYGADIMRPAPLHALAPARRKELLIRVARMASNRLHYINDPIISHF